jgi:hypothetical protein
MTDPRSTLARLRYLAVVVSFAHMAATILRYASGDWYALAVAAGMTLLIDLVTIRLIDYQITATWRVSRWIVAFLALSLALSMALNGVYLWTFRPRDIPDAINALIAVALALFVPGWIAVSAVMHAEWTRHTAPVARHGASATTTPSVSVAPQVSRHATRRTTGDSDAPPQAPSVVVAPTRRMRDSAERDTRDTAPPVSRRTLQRRAAKAKAAAAAAHAQSATTPPVTLRLAE